MIAATIFSILSFFALVAVIYGPAFMQWRRDRRAGLPLAHPVMRKRLQGFREGEIRHHEDTFLTTRETQIFDAYAAEHDWAGDAVDGHQKGETP